MFRINTPQAVHKTHTTYLINNRLARSRKLLVVQPVSLYTAPLLTAPWPTVQMLPLVAVH